MNSFIGDYVKKERIKKKLTRQKLAGHIGYRNLNKGARRIEKLEDQGVCDPVLFQKIVDFMKLNPKCVASKIDQDRKAFYSFVNEPVRMQMIVRLMAAVYAHNPLPDCVKTHEEAISYATDYAKKHHMKVCLVLSRRYSYWIDEHGNDHMRETIFEHPNNEPYSIIGGKRVLFNLKMDSEPSKQFKMR